MNSSPLLALAAAFLVAGLTAPACAQSGVQWKWRDARGQVQYSDLPPPKGTPDDIIQKLAKTLQEALRDPDLVKRFNDINTEPVPQNEATPEALKAKLISEVDRWAPIIKAANQFAD